jgi:hypothetical protein
VLPIFFPGFRFEHPISGQQMRLGGLSYLWAGLLGPIYVLTFRRGGILKTLAISIGYGIALVGVVGASTYVSSVDALLMLMVLIPAVILSHGRAILFVVKEVFARRGWMVIRD